MESVNVVKSLCQGGHSLIETLITLLISGLILLSITGVFVAAYSNNIKMHNRQILSQELKNIISVIQREISRAGFIHLPQGPNVNNENNGADSSNPFLIDGDLYQLNAQRSCITYRYDRDKNGVLNNEFFGFRLSKGKLQQRKGSNVSCEAGLGWEVISDDNSVRVTEFTFTATEVTDPTLRTGRTLLIIKLTAQHKQTEKMILSFSRHVLTRTRVL